MQPSTLTVSVLVACFSASQLTYAGDRVGVTEALRSLSSSWPEAFFSIDVTGIAPNGDAILNHPLSIEYEAAQPGYLSTLRVSSYGELTLLREGAAASQVSGSMNYMPAPPLGGEQLIVLFSSVPLDALLANGATARDFGADRASAEALVRQLNELPNSNVKLSYRRVQYEVATAPGGTEYGDSRGIVLKVLEASTQHPSHFPDAHADSKPTAIPSHLEFEFDSDRLTQRGRFDLDEFGEAWITCMRGSDVELNGHTDSIGTDEYNMALSARRAAVAKQFLASNFGIPESKLRARGMGKSDPIAPNDSEVNRQRNRRVDFVFSMVPDCERAR